MPQLPIAGASIKNEFDLKANGEVSRMRSHKGNMPSLPQTKYCALCPAKFTRTTHLNRHLRSHTNERSHRCNNCTAEFTRSDLLTRHKRTCGDSSNANRSRRKSCQACAESKVKCDLQQPCSKCIARGRDCVFLNDPETSRNKRVAKKASITPSDDSKLPDSPPTSLSSFTESSPASSLSVASLATDTNPYPIPSSSFTNQPISGPSFGSAGASSSECSSVSSSRSSPRLEFYDQRGFTSSVVDSEQSGFFSNSIDQQYTNNSFPSCLLRPQHEEAGYSTGWPDTNQNQSSCAAYGSFEQVYYPSHSQTNDPDFVSDPANLTRISSPSSKTAFSRQQFSTTIPTGLHAGPISPPSAVGFPTTEEFNHYLYLFSTEFNTQIPLFHRATWRTEDTHPILLTAMHACGALLMKSQRAMEFIIKTLTSSGDTVVIEFSKPTCTLNDHMALMLAVVLLQSIIAFQPRLDQLALASMYQEILIMMIRKTGLIKFVNSWSPPDLSNPHTLENAWKNWARYETFKRALVLAYLEDCSYCMYYSAHPAFLSSELEINLPCDDRLWKARTASEWYQLQNMPSPYGTGSARILGTSMHMALEVLKVPASAAIPVTLNPFSLFVLIHSILRDVFTSPLSSGTDITSVHGGGALEIQCALHNWQRMWNGSPEVLQLGQQDQSIPFVYNAVPFFWLAQYAERAKHNGKLIIGSPGVQLSRADGEDRVRAVKGWLSEINATLRSGSQLPSNSSANLIVALGLPSFSRGQ